jgi:Na+/H+-translocating membrane pyrophosphatase
MSIDHSVWPYCSPDFDDATFILTIAKPTTKSVDFPCNMTIDYAMSLPLIMSFIALIFCAALYLMLIGNPVGPKEDNECSEKAQSDPEEMVKEKKIGAEMNEIAKQVQEGAKAFLKEEYFWLAIFVAFMFCVLLVLFTLDDNRTDRTDGIRMAACFFVGAALSATAGYVGMVVATDANVRTTQAARSEDDGGSKGGGLNNALRVAFTGGAVMGFVVVGLGLMGVSLFMLIMSQGRDCEDYKEYYQGNKPNSCESPSYEDALDSLAGFGFGASSIALFARVAGGIYTKAADVGADLVGKVENSIPEDSAENPATIADNVGDVAGMGADLFESFVGSIIAAATLANGDIAKISFPFWLAGAGVLASIIGYFCVSISDEGDDQFNLNEKHAMTVEDHRNKYFKCSKDDKGEVTYTLKPKYNKDEKDNITEQKDGKDIKVIDDVKQQAQLMFALEKGTIASALVLVGAAACICHFLFNDSDYQNSLDTYYLNGPSYNANEAWRIFGCVLIGLLCGILIGFLTEYCTSYAYAPVKSISRSGNTGPATVIIQGLGVGMISCFPPTLVIVATILSCNALMQDYGVAVAAVGMLSTLGMTLATDAYGPVADNAGGCAEMVEDIPDSVRSTTDALDALGNTTAATGKGFAIGSAVLTSLSLLNAFQDRVTDQGTTLDTSVSDSIVLAGIVFGSMLPFLFGALTMISVGLSAQDLMGNVREQFMKKREVEYQMNGKSLSEITKNDSDVQKILWTKNVYDSKSNEFYQQHYTEEERKADPRFFVKPDGIDLRWVFDSCVTDLVGGKAVQLHNTTAVHHQWKEMRTKGVNGKDGWKPDSAQCIAISTSSSIKEMVLPGVYAIWTPVFVGFLVGPRCLMGMLAGSVGAGAMMAIMMSNAGGAWDNSKKYIEIAQAHGGKGTDIHKACVVGDTVGDPFKDTSGPALNILLKLMAMVSLTISTLLKGQDDWELWYYMFIPLAIMIIATILVLYFNYAQREDFEVDTEPEETPAPAPVPTPPPVVETPMEPVKGAEPEQL